MVIDCLNYLPGVIAREAAALSLISGGRFDLGIGAGDYFEEARAWGTEVPPPLERIARLKETSEILRRCWQGESVTFNGEYLHLQSALATPTPSTPPRLIVGAGSSRRLIHSAVTYADEMNVYGESELLRFASAEIAASGRSVALSAYVWDWPEQLAARLVEWEQLGVERTFITLWPPFDLSRLTALQQP